MRRWFIILMLVALTLAVYGPAVRHDFVSWDDESNIVANPLLNPPTRANILELWRTAPSHLYPLTFTLWAAETRLGAGPPGGAGGVGY